MIQVLYDCAECGIKEAAVRVPDRKADEVVTDWLDMVRAHLSVDHRARSPLCVSDKCDLKIPLAPGSNRIGEPTRQ